MRRFQQNLSNFKRGDFYAIFRKIILNEGIERKDFLEFWFSHVKFFNCSFRNVTFSASQGYSLKFTNCQLSYAIFLKTDLTNIIFRDYQFIGCNFAGSYLIDIHYINCQLNRVYFNATSLDDFKFEKSHLLDVSFGGSNIENSTLKDICFRSMVVWKTSSKDGILTEEEIPIQNYTSFLAEFVKE